MTTPVCASCGRPVGDGAVGHGIIAGPLGRSTRQYEHAMENQLAKHLDARRE